MDVDDVRDPLAPQHATYRPPHTILGRGSNLRRDLDRRCGREVIGFPGLTRNARLQID